jgi:hypothetical protein
MSGGGGKGGSQSQTTEIPAWLRDPAIRNLERAETVQKMEYQPWTGIDVAAYNPTQEAAMQMNLNTANAFGMMPQGYENISPTQGMPETVTQGGITGYSSFPMYDLAVQEAAKRDPRTAEIRENLYN